MPISTRNGLVSIATLRAGPHSLQGHLLKIVLETRYALFGDKTPAHPISGGSGLGQPRLRMEDQEHGTPLLPCLTTLYVQRIFRSGCSNQLRNLMKAGTDLNTKFDSDADLYPERCRFMVDPIWPEFSMDISCYIAAN